MAFTEEGIIKTKHGIRSRETNLFVNAAEKPKCIIYSLVKTGFGDVTHYYKICQTTGY